MRKLNFSVIFFEKWSYFNQFHNFCRNRNNFLFWKENRWNDIIESKYIIGAIYTQLSLIYSEKFSFFEIFDTFWSICFTLEWFAILNLTLEILIKDFNIIIELGEYSLIFSKSRKPLLQQPNSEYPLFRMKQITFTSAQLCSLVMLY